MTAIPPDKKTLSAMTVAELKKLASKGKVALKSTLKSDMVSELLKALKSAKPAKPAKKAAKKTTAKKAAAKTSATKKAAAKKTAVKKTAKKAVKKAAKKAAPAAKKAATKKTVKKAAPKSAATRTAKPVKAVKKAAPVKPINKSAPKPATVGATAPSAPSAKTVQPPLATPRPEWAPADRQQGNWASSIPVQPDKVFVSWELSVDTVRQGQRLVLRVKNTDSGNGDAPFIQVPLSKTTGGMFVNVAPGHSYEATVGIMSIDGTFMPIVTTRSVYTPKGAPSVGESLMPEEHFGFVPSTRDDPTSSK